MSFLNFSLRKLFQAWLWWYAKKKKNFISFWKKESHFLELIVWKYMKFDLTHFFPTLFLWSKIEANQSWCSYKNIERMFVFSAMQKNWIYILTDFFRNLTEMNLTIRFIDISWIIALANNQKAIFKMMDHRHLIRNESVIFRISFTFIIGQSEDKNNLSQWIVSQMKINDWLKKQKGIPEKIQQHGTCYS